MFPYPVMQRSPGYIVKQKINNWPGMVTHTCNPSSLKGQGGWITRGQEFQNHLANMTKPISTKNTKISQAWWWVPVIPAIQRLRQENRLNQGGRICSEPRSLLCTPAWVTKFRLCLKKKKKRRVYSLLQQIHFWKCIPNIVRNKEGL